jgi:hypothetical protein
MPRGRLISELLDRLVEIPILDRTMSGRTRTVLADIRYQPLLRSIKQHAF